MEYLLIPVIIFLVGAFVIWLIYKIQGHLESRRIFRMFDQHIKEQNKIFIENMIKVLEESEEFTALLKKLFSNKNNQQNENRTK